MDVRCLKKTSSCSLAVPWPVCFHIYPLLISFIVSASEFVVIVIPSDPKKIGLLTRHRVFGSVSGRNRVLLRNPRRIHIAGWELSLLCRFRLTNHSCSVSCFNRSYHYEKRLFSLFFSRRAQDAVHAELTSAQTASRARSVLQRPITS